MPVTIYHGYLWKPQRYIGPRELNSRPGSCTSLTSLVQAIRDSPGATGYALIITSIYSILAGTLNDNENAVDDNSLRICSGDFGVWGSRTDSDAHANPRANSNSNPHSDANANANADANPNPRQPVVCLRD